MPMPITDADLAKILERPGYRISPQSTRTDLKPQTAPQPCLERASPDRANVASKDKGSGDNLRKLALAMSEDDLQQSVVDLAHLYGWRIAHFRSVLVTKKDGTTFWQTPVAADGEGFPDLIAVRRNRILAIELKRERGKPDPNQVAWLHAFMLTRRIETFLWKPSQWLDGTIEALLR